MKKKKEEFLRLVVVLVVVGLFSRLASSERDYDSLFFSLFQSLTFCLARSVLFSAIFCCCEFSFYDELDDEDCLGVSPPHDVVKK